MTLNDVFNIFYLVLKYNIYINLKLVPFPIEWWEKLFFVTIMNNVTASQRAFPPISKIAKMDKNGLLKNDHLRLTNIC